MDRETEKQIIDTIATLWEAREQKLLDMVDDKIRRALAEQNTEAARFLAETVNADG